MSAPAVPNAERAHVLFRGSAEVAKGYRAAGILLEIIAAGIAYSALVPAGQGLFEYGGPLLSMVLLFGAAGLRILADRSTGYALKCRRASAHAFGLGTDVDPLTLANMETDAPWRAEHVALRLFPDTSLVTYYEPSVVAGPGRLREIYAHSAHYTWRLLRFSALVLGVLSFTLLVGAVVALYAVGVVEQAAADALTLLDLICGFVLAGVLLRVIVVAVRLGRGAAAARKLHDRLMRAEAGSPTRILELANEYDLARAAQPAVPTWAYRFRRADIARTWDIARRALAT